MFTDNFFCIHENFKEIQLCLPLLAFSFLKGMECRDEKLELAKHLLEKNSQSDHPVLTQVSNRCISWTSEERMKKLFIFFFCFRSYHHFEKVKGK